MRADGARNVVPAPGVNRGALVACAVLLLLVPAPAFADKLEVEVLGLGGSIQSVLGQDDLKKNVFSVLSIDDARKDKNLDERKVRKLHELAPEEIKRALAPFGYFKPVIDAKLTKNGDTWVATYRIDPGPEMRVSQLDLTVGGEGAEDARFKGLADGFPLKKGDVFASPAYEAGKKSFEELAAEIGYMDAGFTEHRADVDLETYTSTATLRFDTGPLYFFGPTIFHQDFLDPRLLLGYVTWKEGTPLNVNELLKLQGALSDSPYFSRVEVEAKHEDAGPDRRVPVVVDLLPSKPIKFHFGLGYGTDTGPRGTGLVEFRRLNRRGHRVETNLTLSGIEKSFAARYIIPGPFPRTDVLTFSLGYAQFRPGTSKSNTALAGVEYAQSRGRWRQTLGLFMQREQFAVGVDVGTSYLFMPSARWERVNADDRLFTHRGYKISIEARGAAKNVLSDTSFVRPYVTGKLVRTIAPRTRFIARAEAGYILTNDFHKLPPRIRFFAGGDQSVRGYRFQQLGYLDVQGNVIGGEVLRSISLEVDRMVSNKFGGLGVAVFVDAGNATKTFTEKMKKGTGFGVRWRSPIGMVRADAAWALDLPNHPIRFHLNIGPDL